MRWFRKPGRSVGMADEQATKKIDELYVSIQKRNRCMPSSRYTINKVPKKLRRVKEEADAYIPEILSIGPFHHDRDSLKATTEGKKEKDSFKAMEQHKDWYLNAFLSRFTLDSPEVKLKEFIETMKSLERKTRECYAEPIDLTSDQFVEIMLLDSCFILELFIRKHENDDDKRKNGTGKEFKNDPIFNTVWMMESLQRDLILLENQLPFIVFERLFESVKDQLDLDRELGGLSLIQLAVKFFDSVRSSFGVATQKPFGEYKHLLHLLHSILIREGKPEGSNRRSQGAAANNQNATIICQNLHFLPCNYLFGKTSDKRKTWEYIHCATELQEAGVNFKEKKDAKSLLDINFDKNGVLQIPRLKLADYTDPLLRNLLALEQCNDEYGSGITSYAALLDSLISTQKDVRLLRRRKIFDCGLDDHDEAALAFNKLGDGVMVREFYFDEICSKVNAYYRTDWHRWKSILKREYFKNPWASISILVGFGIMALSLTQTVFSILSYYNRK